MRRRTGPGDIALESPATRDETAVSARKYQSNPMWDARDKLLYSPQPGCRMPFSPFLDTGSSVYNPSCCPISFLPGVPSYSHTVVQSSRRREEMRREERGVGVWKNARRGRAGEMIRTAGRRPPPRASQYEVLIGVLLKVSVCSSTHVGWYALRRDLSAPSPRRLTPQSPQRLRTCSLADARRIKDPRHSQNDHQNSFGTSRRLWKERKDEGGLMEPRHRSQS